MCFPLDGPRNYLHDDVGYNYRMSNIHAAIGCAQTEKIEQYIDLRIKNNFLYKKYLSQCSGVYFQKDEINCKNVHWMNAIVIDPKEYGHTRDELMSYLKDNNIDSRLLFNSMSRQKSLLDYGCDCSDNKEAKDVDFLLSKYKTGIKNVIIFGCGTGKHDRELYRLGYKCHGIDLSSEMISEARKGAEEAGMKIEYEVSDIRTYRSELKYDSVVSLFHVFSYQTTNKDITDAFISARNVLDKGGLFLFDVWY